MSRRASCQPELTQTFHESEADARVNPEEDGRGYFLTQELQNLGELGLSRFCKNELSSMGTYNIQQEEGCGIADLRHYVMKEF